MPIKMRYVHTIPSGGTAVSIVNCYKMEFYNGVYKGLIYFNKNWMLVNLNDLEPIEV